RHTLESSSQPHKQIQRKKEKTQTIQTINICGQKNIQTQKPH
ncbi:6992_t:CDS:1, partial [Acaulospora morrowiae]